MTGSRNRTTRREFFRLKNPGESYGIVRAALGDGRFRVEADNMVVVARIRGNMRDRIYVRVDDVVLVDGILSAAAAAVAAGRPTIRIVKKYSQAEIQMLRDADGFTPPPAAAATSSGGGDEGDLGFDFEVI